MQYTLHIYVLCGIPQFHNKIVKLYTYILHTVKPHYKDIGLDHIWFIASDIPCYHRILPVNHNNTLLS